MTVLLQCGFSLIQNHKHVVYRFVLWRQMELKQSIVDFVDNLVAFQLINTCFT